MPNFKTNRGFKMKGFSTHQGTSAAKYAYKSPAKQPLPKMTDDVRKKMYEKQQSDLKEWLITDRGFNLEDADRMIESGAYTHSDYIRAKLDQVKSNRPGKKTTTQEGTNNKKGEGDTTPAKQYKKPVGPRAEEKTKSIEEHNIEAQMHNVKEIADREKHGKYRHPKPQRILLPEITVTSNREDRPDPTYEGTDEYRTIDEIRADAELGKIDRGPISQDQDPTWAGTDEYRTIDEIFEDADRGRKIREAREKAGKK
tara:strand:+ start:224 stop:988 length:765 start_codon:yes stop_codon:yes gene_type:complete